MRSTNLRYHYGRQTKHILLQETKSNLCLLLQTMFFTVSFVLSLATSSPHIHVQTSTSSTGWMECGLTMTVATLHSPLTLTSQSEMLNPKAS